LAVGAVAALFVAFLAAVSLLDYTESTSFCSSCHVMKPEVTVHRNSPHARTDCGTCHVGPGVVSEIKAKLENARYLWVYPLKLYEKPIPSPIKSLRPAEVVCEQCHWPQKFYNDRLAIIPRYAPDEVNSLTRTQLVLRTGGGTRSAGQGRGIHWHIENPVYFIATDEKLQNIPWVQAVFEGVTTEYVSVDANLTAEYVAKAEKHKMDCVDCHNRATHVFRNPEDALDAALANGAIARDLPFIKREGMKVLDKIYGTEEEAATAIAAVEEFYRSTYPQVYATRAADVKAAVAGLQGIFDNTQFPFMNVNWQSHTNNIGHANFAGCFRCHDGKHLSQKNETIRLECNVCHSLPQVAGPGKQLPALSLATPKQPQSHLSTSWLAEHRFRFDASCTACHTVDNPGGKDDTSFCSNSACHGTVWSFAGLNAPKIRELSAPPKAPSAGGPAAVPHPIGARTDCLLCHSAGKVKPFPANHSAFTIEMCTNCHKASQTDAAATPAAPAPTATARPPAQPTAAPTTAPIVATPTTAVPPTAAPTPSARPAGTANLIPHSLDGRDDCLVCHDTGKMKPFPANHAGRTKETCLACHKVKS
jgi:nitrate/TMAO reductase-like tetraheme cytochrome c subunit